jgi:spoIIIJ-associated protein
MESVEVSARNVDEAIDIALSELGLKRTQVTIEVLTAGKAGLFGLGGEQARVRVTALEGEEARPMEHGGYDEEGEMPAEVLDDGRGEIDLAEIDSEEVVGAEQFLRDLLEMMDIDADLSVREPETAADGLGRSSAVLDVEGEDLGLLIGRRGTTLSALQYLVNVMMTRKTGSKVLVTVDVEHYHRRREETLQGLARRMADRVRQSRRPMTLEPMPANERRIIHLALAQDNGVQTGSVGMGEERKVVIRPRGGGQGGDERDRQGGRPMRDGGGGGGRGGRGPYGR